MSKKVKLHEMGGPLVSPIDVLNPDIFKDSFTGDDIGVLRTDLVDVLNDTNSKWRDVIAKRLVDDPMYARTAIGHYSALTDQIIISAMNVITKKIYPNEDQLPSLSVLAVGGYGRAEMAPQSDVDLLLLIDGEVTKWHEKTIETLLYVLWDIGLKVGHAVRNISQCLELAKSDITIRTSLLEKRYIWGERATAVDLNKQLWEKLFLKTAAEFVEAKLLERDERHKKNGGTRYTLEPNIKEGKGGLRDLQTLFWLGKYLYQVDSVNDILQAGMISEEEFLLFDEAQNFLWAVRCQLHLLSGRPTEKLSFNYQVEIAERFGYQDTEARLGVEQFMQAYFRHSVMVGDLTRIFLVVLEQDHVKQRPNIRKKIKDIFILTGEQKRIGMTMQGGRLAIKDEDLFFSDPVNILRIFEHAIETGLLLHPQAMRQITHHLELLDEDVRTSECANQIFLRLLQSPNSSERALRRMNELGVLAQFIPEWEHIFAMMQFNMYHHYTVDEHTIQCVAWLSKIEQGDLIEDLPVASEILKKGVNRRVLYVAMLLHDIGKGRTDDHSVVGAKLARKICKRMGLSAEDTDTVTWLVLNHLLMSDTAQKRDLTDAKTVQTFAEQVGSIERLQLLCVLTVCDIRGVGPDVWNNWKAQLLRNTYRATLRLLNKGYKTEATEGLVLAMQNKLKSRLKNWNDAELIGEINRHYPPYWLGLDTDAHYVFAELSKSREDEHIASSFHLDETRDATRACFIMADHPGQFSRMAGALALVGANVVDARIYTSSDGYAYSLFWIQDLNGHPFPDYQLKGMGEMIEKTMNGKVIAREALRKKDRFKKRERDFKVPTSINFDNVGSEFYTIIEVDTRDRPGLLFDLTYSLTRINIYIASAVIATYGEQAVDVFYVKDMFGMKIQAQAKQERIADRLQDAIDIGYESALNG